MMDTDMIDYHLYYDRAESMTKDLTSSIDRPIWPLTSYGPAKFQPTLIAGLDESPEELRVKAATAAKTGAIQEYVRRSVLGLNLTADNQIHFAAAEIRIGTNSKRRTDVQSSVVQRAAIVQSGD